MTCADHRMMYRCTQLTYCDKPPLMYSLGPIRTLLALFLFCDRPSTGDVRGSGDTAPTSAFRVGSLVAERSYRVCGPSYPVRPCIPVEPLGGPNTLLLPIRPSSPTFVPCFVPSSHVSSPKEEVREVLSVGLRVRVTFTLFYKKTAFYRPNKASDWSILTSRDFR